MEIKYKKLREDAVAPYRRFDVDAGFDFTAIWKEVKDKYTEYGTGIAIEIPSGYVGYLFPRSSVRDQDFMMKNSVGVVDASYRGEIKFSFANVIHDMFENVMNADELSPDYSDGKAINIKLLNRHMDHYKIGDRVGQLVIMKKPDIKWVEVKELSETKRGTAGYGSSGN